MSGETRTRWTRVARGGARRGVARGHEKGRSRGRRRRIASIAEESRVRTGARRMFPAACLVERRGEMTRRAREFGGSDRWRGGAYLDSRDDDARGGSDGLGLDARRAAAAAARGVDRPDRRGWLWSAPSSPLF